MISEVTNEDCMLMMARYPDKFFDLAIVDPPYGIGEDGRKTRGRNIRKDGSFIPRNIGNGKRITVKPKDYKGGNWDNEIPSDEYFFEIMAKAKNLIIWGGNYFTHILPVSMGWIVWDKVNGENDFADCELAWTSFDKAVRKFRYKWAGMLQENMSNKEERMHPTQKPVALYTWLLNTYGGEGNKILDTHLGSGSSRIAAYKLGFDFWGCEIDKDYFEAQEKRFKEAINEPLFQTQPERIQAKLL